MTVMRFENVWNWNVIVTIVIVAASVVWQNGKSQAESATMREVLVEIRSENAGIRQELQVTRADFQRQIAETKAEAQREQREQEVRIRATELSSGRVEERLNAIQRDIQQLLQQQERQGAN